jgi:signal transduction histidine kinase
MIIGPLIKKNYFTVNAFHGTHQIRKTISTYGSALVVSEGAKALGVITAHDLATRHHNLVIDCLTDKPVLSRHHEIPEVLSMMKKAHSDILMVYDEDELIGVVHKNDITDYLCRLMEEQKTLVQSIAHDLRNPLSNVMSITHLLGEGEDTPDNKELIVYAQDACRYANDIINDLLFSEHNKSEPLQKESLDLNELILNCVDSFKMTLSQKEIGLNLQLLPHTCYIKADGIKLKRAFSNLLSNAIKFTPAGGLITLSVRKEEGHYMVEIKDNGIGIPHELQPGIFQKFTPAKRQGTNGENSTGLGMYITRQIIEHHGGEVWFESQDKRGATFYVKLAV